MQSGDDAERMPQEFPCGGSVAERYLISLISIHTWCTHDRGRLWELKNVWSLLLCQYLVHRNKWMLIDSSQRHSKISVSLFAVKIYIKLTWNHVRCGVGSRQPIRCTDRRIVGVRWWLVSWNVCDSAAILSVAGGTWDCRGRWTGFGATFHYWHSIHFLL